MIHHLDRRSLSQILLFLQVPEKRLLLPNQKKRKTSTSVRISPVLLLLWDLLPADHVIEFLIPRIFLPVGIFSMTDVSNVFGGNVSTKWTG